MNNTHSTYLLKQMTLVDGNNNIDLLRSTVTVDERSIEVKRARVLFQTISLQPH
jgi:hypothetical protein